MLHICITKNTEPLKEEACIKATRVRFKATVDRMLDILVILAALARGSQASQSSRGACEA